MPITQQIVQSRSRQIVLTAFVSLVAGGSLGPEAPLADACGGLGSWVSDRLKLDEHETRAMGYSGVSGMLARHVSLVEAESQAGELIEQDRLQIRLKADNLRMRLAGAPSNT